jgi:hypothetical protein
VLGDPPQRKLSDEVEMELRKVSLMHEADERRRWKAVKRQAAKQQAAMQQPASAAGSAVGSSSDPYFERLESGDRYGGMGLYEDEAPAENNKPQPAAEV